MNDRDDREEAAMRWVVRLEDDPSPATRQAFDEWVALDPTLHREAFEQMSAAWEDTNVIGLVMSPDDPVDADMFELLELPIEEPRVVPWRRWTLAAACVAALAVGIAYQMNSTGATYMTDIGQFQEAALPDGSRTYLNTNTIVESRFTPIGRRLILVEGEARFVVQHERFRGLEVLAGSVTIRAVGTDFSVRLLDDGNVELTVVEGTVSVDRELLHASEVVTITPLSLSKQRLTDSQIRSRLEWITGHLEFNDKTVTEVVAEFNRYNRRALVIRDASVGNRRFGGRFRKDDLPALARALTKRGIDVDLSEKDPSQEAQIVLADIKR